MERESWKQGKPGFSFYIQNAEEPNPKSGFQLCSYPNSYITCLWILVSNILLAVTMWIHYTGRIKNQIWSHLWEFRWDEIVSMKNLEQKPSRKTLEHWHRQNGRVSWWMNGVDIPQKIGSGCNWQDELVCQVIQFYQLHLRIKKELTKKWKFKIQKLTQRITLQDIC